MILLDTHIWIWWVQGDSRLPRQLSDVLNERASDGLAVSAISCWEVANIVARGRLILTDPVDHWIDDALDASGVALLPLTPAVAVEASRLPDLPLKDPADRIIIATARLNKCELATMDGKIRTYPHVRLL